MAKTSRYHLSQELIFEILLYLPVISLLRFRSVCKSWRSMISDQQFVTSRLAMSQKKQATLSLLDNDFDHVHVDTREEYVKLNVPPQCNGKVRWICSCNGLVCLAEQYGNVIYFWNPSTKQLKKVVAPKAQEAAWDVSDFLFVFCPPSNDYKLLRLTVRLIYIYFHPDEGEDISHELIADLYSSNMGCFKQIKVPESLKNIEVRTNSKYVHDLKTGVVFFEGTDELVSFDLDKEVFGVYPYPIPDPEKHSKSNVLDFEGSAAMIFEAVDGSVLSLWTLDNVCGDKVSWTKKFNFEADVKIDWVFLYLGVGQFVAKNDGVNIFYDYEKKDTKKLLSAAPVGLGQFNSVVKYTESIVSLDGFQGFELVSG